MQLTLSSPTIWLATQPIDFRKAIDGLTQVALSQPSANLQDDVFVFYNRRRDKLKLLAWHGNGFVLIYKRLETGKFTVETNNSGQYQLNETQLSWLLAGLDWKTMSDWGHLSFDNFY